MIHSFTSPRWISRCLVFLLFVFMVAPMNRVYALEGNGTSNDPFRIYTSEDFNQIRHNLVATYVLMNDIDLSEFTSWVPIGTSANPFRGSLNGQGYSIRNLTVNRAANYSGLFGVVKGTTSFSLLENLHLVNIRVVSQDYTGGLVGWLDKGNIRNVSMDGVVNGRMAVGGLVGFASYGSMMDSVFVSGQVSGWHSGIGGVIGRLSNSILSNAKSLVSVYGTMCEPSLSGVCKVGGVVGMLDTGSPKVIHSIFDGTLQNKVEPIAGSTSSKFAQPMVGSLEAGSVENSYFRFPVVVFSGVGAQISEKDWINKDSFIGMDFESMWIMEDGPTLGFMPRFKTMTTTSSLGGKVEMTLNGISVSAPVIALVGSELCVYIVEDPGYRYVSGGELQWCITVSDDLVIVAQFVLVGDVNLDGKLSATDLVLLRRFVAGLIDVTEEQQSAMDVNGDGRTSARDVVMLHKLLAEME